MTTTDNQPDPARLKATASFLRRMADSAVVLPDTKQVLRAEADRLDPPAPTGKTMTWRDHRYTMTPEGIAYHRLGMKVVAGLVEREFLDAVVLPLLADAPDGPIPDETVDAAVYAWDVARGDRKPTENAIRDVLLAVRGLPGMAVVRAGKPPEVLRWEVWDKDGERIVRCGTRETAREFIRQYHEDDVVRVVAIIADPREGTV